MKPHLRFEYSRRVIELSFPEYSQVRQAYWQSIRDGIKAYGTDTAKDDDWLKTVMRAAIELAFLRTAAIAFGDGSGEDKIRPDILAWVLAYKVAEFSFTESLLLSLRLKKFPPGETSQLDEEEEDIIWEDIASRRANMWSQGLDILYNTVKVRAAGSKLLLFTGYDGTESCFDCQKYKGLKKPAIWWITNNAVPPNRDFECKGYNCLHVLVDPATGNIFTI